MTTPPPAGAPTPEPVCSFDDSPFGPGDRCEAAGHTRAESDAYEAHYARFIHDCPREAFLDDEITRAYGAGGMVSLIDCPVCDRLEGE